MNLRIVMLASLVACASAHANRFDEEMTFKYDNCKVSGSVVVDEEIKAYSVQQAIRKHGADKVVIPKPTLEFCVKLRDEYGHVQDMVRVVNGKYRTKGVKDGEYNVSLGVMDDGLCQDEMPQWSATAPFTASQDLWIDFRCRQISGEFTEVDFSVFDGFSISGEVAVPDEVDPTGTPVIVKCGSRVCGKGTLDEVGEYRVWVGTNDAKAGSVSVDINFSADNLEHFSVRRQPMIIGAKHLILDLALVAESKDKKAVVVAKQDEVDLKDLIIVDDHAAAAKTGSDAEAQPAAATASNAGPVGNALLQDGAEPVVKQAIVVPTSSSRLHVRKSVFNVTRNADGELASRCDVLRYTWHYEVKGQNPVHGMTIEDETPEHTVLEREPSCAARSTCKPNVVDGRRGRTAKVKWHFPKQLQPGTSGHVSFDVRVDPKRECPS